MDTQEELVRLFALHIRLQLSSQGATILELNRIGFRPARIAEILGTTSNTVNVALQRGKKTQRNSREEQ